MSEQKSPVNIVAITHDSTVCFYPEYLSINNGPGKGVTVIVRGMERSHPEKGHPISGEVGEIVLTEKECNEMIDQLLARRMGQNSGEAGRPE